MTGRRYAEGTSVSVKRSRAEVEALLERYGATAFAYGQMHGRHAIMFEIGGRQVRIAVARPDPAAHRTVNAGARGQVERTAAQLAARLAQEEERLWRSLVLILKAKLEAVASGIRTFEEEFLSDVVLPDGRTVGEHARPVIEQAYLSGRMAPLLPYFEDGR